MRLAVCVQMCLAAALLDSQIYSTDLLSVPPKPNRFVPTSRYVDCRVLVRRKSWLRRRQPELAADGQFNDAVPVLVGFLGDNHDERPLSELTTSHRQPLRRNETSQAPFIDQTHPVISRRWHYRGRPTHDAPLPLRRLSKDVRICKRSPTDTAQ